MTQTPRFFLVNASPRRTVGPNGISGQNILCFFDNRLNVGVPTVLAPDTGPESRVEVTAERLGKLLPCGLHKKIKHGHVTVLVDDGRGPMALRPEDVETIAAAAAA